MYMEYARKLSAIQRRLTGAGLSHRERGGKVEVWVPASGAWVPICSTSPSGEVRRGSDAFSGVFLPLGGWVSAL